MSLRREELAEGIRALGIRRGDMVFLHSSMKSLGDRVKDGPDTLIDAFLEVIGKEGTLAVPTLTATFVSGKPSGLVWDPKTTPSRVGLLTDVFWRRPDAVRSAHPTHSIAAIGLRAKELVEDHPLEKSIFHTAGPFGKFVRWGGTIVFVGTGLGCNTLLHAVEEWMGLPHMPDAPAIVRGPEGKDVIVNIPRAPGGHRDFYLLDSKINRLIEQSGKVREGTLGRAVVQMIRAKDVIRIVVKALLADPQLYLCPGCEFCDRYRAACREAAADFPRRVAELRALTLFG